jgi:hypothetical protein
MAHELERIVETVSGEVVDDRPLLRWQEYARETSFTTVFHLEVDELWMRAANSDDLVALSSALKVIRSLPPRPR